MAEHISLYKTTHRSRARPISLHCWRSVTIESFARRASIIANHRGSIWWHYSRVSQRGLSIIRRSSDCRESNLLPGVRQRQATFSSTHTFFPEHHLHNNGEVHGSQSRLQFSGRENANTAQEPGTPLETYVPNRDCSSVICPLLAVWSSQIYREVRQD